MFINRGKYKIFYVLEGKSMSSGNAKPKNDLDMAYNLLDHVKEKFYIGIYCIQKRTARVLIRWNETLNCYNVETSFGDDGLFRNFDKKGVVEFLDNFDEMVKFSRKFGFTEDQAPWANNK